MPQLDLTNFGQLFLYDPHNPLLFNTGFFLFFFVVTYAIFGFFKNNTHRRNIYLMVVSMYFYYKSSGVFIFLLFLKCLINYFVGRRIDFSIDRKEAKKWLIAGLTANLGILSYFKYTNFFVGSIMNLFNQPFNGFDIILPIGISFFTFQSMSYIIDVYRGKIKSLDSLLDFSFFVSFFPQLVAGPIVRAADFIPQLKKPSIITQEMMGRALFLILGGLFKKIVISDFISVNFVDRIFESPMLYSGLENLIGVYGYALQIYCDFSGYSDIAIGLALLFGFHFNINFDSPYQSSSITEFWRRWHISLSTWLKDYLYIPLGGNRKGRLRTDVNLMITMLLGGLWHGASFNFILWGAWHGILLILDKLRMQLFPRKIENPVGRAILKGVGVFVTFHLVCFGWIFFRAESIEVAQGILNQIIHAFHPQLFLQFITGYKTVTLTLLVGYLLHFANKKSEEKVTHWITYMHWSVQVAILVTFIILLYQVRSSEILPFIYFQF